MSNTPHETQDQARRQLPDTSPRRCNNKAHSSPSSASAASFPMHQMQTIPAPPPFVRLQQSPPAFRNYQAFTPTKPSPLSQIYFPAADPDFDLTPNTNINVSPGMNIDSSLQEWPDENPDWPESDELDEIFGPATASPIKSGCASNVHVEERRPLARQHDFTLIPTPLNLTPTRTRDSQLMFGDLMPAPLSPSRLASTDSATQSVAATDSKPLTAIRNKPTSIDSTVAGRDGPVAGVFGGPERNALHMSDTDPRAAQTYITKPSRDTQDINTQLIFNQMLGTDALVSSGASSYTNVQPSRGKVTLRCNLCQLQFVPSRYTIRPDQEGRAYCAECIKTVGDRIVAEQKVERGIGRAGKLAAARERTRVGGGGVDDDEDTYSEHATNEEGEAEDMDTEDVAKVKILSDELANAAFWAEFMNADFVGDRQEGVRPASNKTPE